MPLTAQPATDHTTLTMPIAKVDMEQRNAFGWASVAKLANGAPLIDRQDDILDIPSMEHSVYAYILASGEGGEMHTRTGVAKVCESVFFTPEKLEAMGLPRDAIPDGSWWLGVHVTDDAAWEGIKSGKYTSFSIGGLGQREAWKGAA